MISKKTLMIRLIIIFAVFGLSFGLSSAYFVTSISGNDTASSVNLKIINLAINLIDEPGVSVINVMPNSTIQKSVTVENPSAEDFTFSLVWNNVENGFSDRHLLTYEISCVSYADYNDLESPESPSTCTGINPAYSPSSDEGHVGIISEVTIPAGKAYKYVFDLTVSSSLPAGVIVSFAGGFAIVEGAVTVNIDYVP